jgi:hypothetical protein
MINQIMDKVIILPASQGLKVRMTKRLADTHATDASLSHLCNSASG